MAKSRTGSAPGFGTPPALDSFPLSSGALQLLEDGNAARAERLRASAPIQRFACDTPRLCQRYCNALVLRGFALARCPHCAHCEWLIELFGRRP